MKNVVGPACAICGGKYGLIKCYDESFFEKEFNYLI